MVSTNLAGNAGRPEPPRAADSILSLAAEQVLLNARRGEYVVA